MNPNGIDSDDLRSQLQSYGEKYPDALDDDTSYDTIGDEYSSDRYSGSINGTQQGEDSGQKNAPTIDEEELDSLGYKSPKDFGGPRQAEGEEDYQDESNGFQDQPQKKQQGRKNKGVNTERGKGFQMDTLASRIIGALVAGAICYFVILPMMTFALRSVFNIQPQWYDNYEDITNEYFSENRYQTDIKEPIGELKNIREHVSDTFTEITGINLDPKMKDGKTILRVPFIVGTDDIRTTINGDEYAIEVPKEALLSESEYNRAEIELSILDREVQGVKFIKFVNVVEGKKK